MTAATVARGRMPLAQHLGEARRRAVRASVALVVGAILGYVLSDQILDILRTPVAALAESRDAALNYDSVTGAFDLRLKIALFAGVVLSSPVWLYELFAFLSPGLTRREKAYTFGFLGAAAPLFAAGCFMGFSVFPHMVELLAGFASEEDSTILLASHYFDFVMKIIVATGVAFVLPVFIVMFNLLGVLSARTIAKSWRICIVAIMTFSAMVTPSADVLSMFLIAIPMCALFAAAYLVAYLHDRRVARRIARLETAPVPVTA
ncbi:Sec-independent protein translocase protein TatC [Microbacterium barkeri]|uniref:Sec-independent protein translocase protein TatC n=1 Tax=Microbacterium barkeri TaxID=33917 RepID=A0A9W6H2A1_9MICO|nr:twin-arginine translocase subunit TatC [Microbacterium barkeri]MDR6877792.1 sec-independent protein translocase protein TatC [Microbacterium barkeri]GLJ60948.1 Sec-independent protein translocase protein TatC [Microbacterium barkeri]